MTPRADIPGISIHPLPPAAAHSLRFNILPALEPPPPIAAAIDDLWSSLRAHNPRLFDGPIVLTDTATAVLASAAPNNLPARRATYKTLATAADVGLTVRALGVQALITAHDAAHTPHLLLARRSSEVRMYPGLWENAPSGTLTPPPAHESAITLDHFTKALIAEGLEELGLNLHNTTPICIALLDDAEAHSLDAVLSIHLEAPINPRTLPCPTHDHGRWEYADTAWIALPDLPTWLTKNAHAISPPTRALIPWFLSTRPL